MRRTPSSSSMRWTLQSAMVPYLLGTPGASKCARAPPGRRDRPGSAPPRALRLIVGRPLAIHAFEGIPTDVAAVVLRVEVEVAQAEPARRLPEVPQDLLLALVVGAGQGLEQVDDVRGRSVVGSRLHQGLLVHRVLHRIQVG